MTTKKTIGIIALFIAAVLILPAQLGAKEMKGEKDVSTEIEEITETETKKEVETTKEVEKVETVEANYKTRCRINFDLKGWSVFYRRAKGTGLITCDNGQSSPVQLSAHGGGITFGKQEIKDGHGTFTKVKDIGKLFGSYAASEAHAGAKKSADAQALTKGKVSLAFSGTGRGYDLGFSFGRFKITPVEKKEEQTAKTENKTD